MSADITVDRRAFVAGALASAGMLATAAVDAAQAPEIPNFATEVPPAATLWGLMVFLADEALALVDVIR